MLNGVIQQWAHDWRNQRLVFWTEFVGVVASLLAAVLISFWPATIDLSWIFSLWLAGSLALAVSSLLRKTAWPLLLMITYTMLNVIGLANTL